MEIGQTLARKLLDQKSQADMNLFLPYVSDKSTKKEAAEIERLVMSLYWSLSYQDKLLYGPVEFPTIKYGVVFYENDVGIKSATGSMLIHQYPSSGDTLWVSVAVRDDCRGSGLSNKMFYSLMELLKEHRPDVKELHWAALDINTPSLKLAKKLGFNTVDLGKRQNFIVLKKSLKKMSESATKHNVRRMDKEDGILYQGPASFLVDKVKVYDNSGDIVLSGRVGNAPNHFSGTKFISTNIKNSPLVLKYLRQFQGHPNGIQLQVNHAEFKKQDGYNYIRVTLSI